MIFALALGAVQAQPLPPTVDAKAWLVMDVTSGQTLAAASSSVRIEPASLTKLMTAYLAFSALKEQRISLDQAVPVSETAYRASGSRMFIDPRKPVTVDELLRGLIVQSGNDAAIAIAELLGGSEPGFAQMMNREGQRLGLTATQFINSTGLPDPQHYTTADDLAKLASRLIQDFPERLALYSQKDYTYNKIRQQNRNRLLWLDPTVDGLKTGRTDSAGWCLIATSRREQPLGNGLSTTRRVLSVVLGANSDDARVQESQKLLNWAHSQWETLRLFRANEAISKITVYKGSAAEVSAGFPKDFFITVPRGSGALLKMEVERPTTLVAPISKGQAIAMLKVSAQGKPVAQIPLPALQSVDGAGIFGRMVDTVRLWFK